MKKSNLLLIGYASFMMLCSGTILGQQGVLLPKIQEEQHECGICCNHESHRPEPQEYIPEIDIRRASVPGDTALIKGATDINKEFGAGESMKITSGNHSTQTVSVPWSLSLNPGGGYKYVPWSSQYATSTTSSLATTPADIKLGSNESKNVVIKAYTGDGFSMGWATVVRAVNYGAGQQPQFNTPAANPIMNVSPTYNAAAFRTWSNVVPYVNTFDTVPTLVDATLNTVKAYTFSKYTYKYFMGMSYVDGVWNYNPWNATSRGNCTYSTIYGRVWPLGTDASFSGDKNPWLAPPYHSPAITNALSTCCSSTLFDMVWEADGAGGGYLWVWHHGSSGLKGLSVSQYPSVNDFHYNSGPYQANALHVGPSDTASAYYTSTIDSFYNRSWAKGYFNDNGITELSYPVDDSVALVQFSGTSMTNAEALAEQSTYMLESDAANPLGAGFNQFYGGSSATAIKNYKRPTTIFLEGDKHEFATFSISDINWYYETDSIYPHQDVANNGYFSGCCAGYMYGYTFNPNWISFYEEGKTLVDGAILLTTNAQVYIDDDIKDATLVPGSKRSGTAGVDAAPDTETAAIVVVPDSVDAGFLLRTAGSWDHMNMYQEDMSKNEKDLFYRQVTYPEPHSDIFLFEGTNTYTYSVRNLFTYNNGGAINIAAPASSGKGSVFGLFGNYIHDGANNANVHTAWGDPSTGGVTKYENPGVIEIGTGISDKNGAALAVDGYKYFNIYSGGTLKNFEGMNWATHKDPANNFAMNFTSADNTPEFILDGKEPLYILNYGSNRTVYDGTSGVLPDADINWHAAGITKLEDALTNTTDIGALQIQAAGDVHFYDAFSPTIPAGKPTELRIFSDNAGVQFLADLTYINNTDTNFVAWANGTNAGRRSCFLDTINSGSGEVLFDGVTRITQDLTGITLLRSENDDVLMSNTFYYTNLNALDDAGEFMMQAGQDIYGLGSVTFEHKGQKSILLEAKKTIHLEDALTITKTGGTTDSITLKAGYDNFSTSAVVSSWDPIANYACALQGNNYANRVPCVSPDGADIWLEGPVAVNLVNIPVDTVATTFRAFNSIYLDNTFDFERAGSGDAGAKGTGGTGRTLLFAETGNIEAIAGSGTDITFTLGDADSSLLTLQAGNQVGGICAAPTQFSCWDLNGNPGAEYDGNILFNNKLTINSEGTGNVLVSSARDIESQISADFTFTFDESGLNPGDVLLTAGRHVETHAPMLFDYKNLNDTSKITIQAGRLDGSSYECSNQLCKAIELGTALTADIYGGSATTAYDPVAAALAPVVDNTFAAGGSGHGSILAFNTIDFKYQGVDTILLTALNGNIESDPYLHGSYPGDAKITFDHQGKGVVRMEAIDIKLHDVLDYQGMHHASDSNGRFYMAAFDSILTRDLTYSNLTDNGSVYITTDKYKASASCDVPYDCTIGGPGIHQGHIVLGYAADCNNANSADKILFDFNSTVQNTNTSGANLYIQAGYEGFSRNKVTGKANTVLFSDRANDRGKGYGGNITFDFMEVYMAKGNGNTGGYAEISTPNGNIWGKDSLQYHGVNGNLLIDAGLGSLEDTLHAVRWSGFANYCQGAGSEEMLNTLVPYACGDEGEWRTGNIMLKGGSVDFTDVFSSGVSGKGNVTFRTREGFIDIYDKFNVTNMSGHYLNYAGMGGSSTKANEWGDVSVRDLEYSPVENSGSLFFGADDNIMLNYGYSNGKEPEYNILSAGLYDVVGADLVANGNPYYSTTYHPSIADCFAKFDVNENGYMWYRNGTSDDGTGWKRKYHRMYRGCSDGIQTPTCSPLTGECETIDNGARALTFNFNTLSDGVTRVKSGGLGVVATNYIDVFTAFTYHGGNGTGLHSVPGMTT
ncbi:MAG: hypothetical protein LBV74_10950, partial [Tannerella sp.]|nr:hypothetical protein [Tannerella sp.]